MARGEMMSLILHPVTITRARMFVNEYHRHHRAPPGGLFAIGAAREGESELQAVAIVGRPISRMLDDGLTAEVTRLCVRDGVLNACSMLYAACWRAARAMGYRRLVTYILASEPGITLRAAGWHCIGQAGGGRWSRKKRPRPDNHPTQKKVRWEMSA